MLRLVLIFIVHRPWRSAPPCCAPGLRRGRRVGLLLLLAAALLPLAARPGTGAPPEPVAEALFLCDPLPPGGRDLGVSLALQPGGAPDGGAATASRLQVALALGDRVGLTADVAVAPGARPGLAAPGASLKVLLRDFSGDALGVAASLDLLGAATLAGAEAALGLGLVQAAGPVTLRASASVATPFARWAPHLHGGASAALALGARWRLLGELIAEVGDGAPAFAAGPAVRVALDGAISIAAGALVDLRAPARAPSLVVQLTRAL